ncbi:hypothetical protein ACSBR2_017943 [Camellia fascicularis]
MARIKPQALLQQSKKKKGPSRIGATTVILYSLIIVVMVFFLFASYRHWIQRSIIQTEYRLSVIEHDDAFADGKKSDVPGYVILNTSKGSITIELYKEGSPEVVDAFIDLCQRGHFKGMPFHHVIKNFVIQGGNSDIPGATDDWTLKVKHNSQLETSMKHEAFMLGTTKAKHDKEGFELFITTAPIPDLNEKLIVFGRVIKGEDVVQEIEEVDTDEHYRPKSPIGIINVTLKEKCACDWDDRGKMFIEVEGILRRQIKMSVIPSVQPFHAIAYPLDPMLALEISHKYAAHCSVTAARYSLPPFNHPAPLPIRGGNGRLRVGYVSSDFGNHQLSHLMGSVFGMHNRENVEVFCYALSPNDGTEWRLRIETEAEHFLDVSSMSSDIIARMINDDQIQILVNLNGYTKGARNEIFAMQPAPIRVSYMGFPGTTGASYIHYLVTDKFVSPSCFSHIYSEKLVHLPHCYFVNDYKQKNCDVLDPKCQPKRSDYGLPEDKFIFLCDTPYKLSNRKVSLSPDAAAQVCVISCFYSEYRPLCNAHTTGTDVLWAGLPMVTLPLEKMAIRVDGSLCLATGVGEEMIVHSMKEYEEKAVSLALNPLKLQDLTNRLKASRLTCPLFDTARWVRNLDRAYFRMWNLYCSGQHPQPFKVTENDSEFP